MKFHRIPGEYAILPRIMSVSFFAHSPIRLLLIVALAGCVVLNPAPALAWGPEGHFQIGTMALQAVDEQACYPPDEVIQSDFADRSWLLIQEQWLKAGKRLARILNATLGTGEVVLDRDP